MQWITPQQLAFIKDYVAVPSVGAILWALLKRAIVSSRNALHAIMTENANRTRDELMQHIDDRFAKHEAIENAEIAKAVLVSDENKRRLGEIERTLTDIIATLRGMKKD